MQEKDIRRAVLEVMNAQRKDSRHEREIRMHVSHVERALRRAGLKVSEKQVMEAVDYLKETGMLKRAQETQTIKTPASRYGSRVTPSSSYKHTIYWYTLSAKAIDEIEGATEYSAKPFVPYPSIQINTTNAPVIIGSNNVVTNHVEVFNKLDELQQLITDNGDVSIEDRQDAAGDIESLKQQLVKPNPNQSVIAELWTNVGRIADIAGVTTTAYEVAKLISAATGHPIA